MNIYTLYLAMQVQGGQLERHGKRNMNNTHCKHHHMTCAGLSTCANLSNLTITLNFEIWGEHANQHRQFLEAMRDLDALVWRLGKMKAPRVSHLKKRFSSWWMGTSKHHGLYNILNVAWCLRPSSEVLVLCIMLLVWTYDTNEDLNRIIVKTNGSCIPTVFDDVHTYPISWLYFTTCPQEFEYLEFYAGRGNLSAAMAGAKYVVRSFDILYNQQAAERGSNYMDLTHSSGFAYHVQTNTKVSLCLLM